MSWPRPAAGPGAVLETAAAWIAVLLAGVATLLAVLIAFQARETQSLRDARLHITLHEIEARLEADLALGYELQDNARAQRLLEDALAHDASLVGAEIFDTRGISLFNTDRGSTGEQVPRSWLEAAASYATAKDTSTPWSVDLAGDRTVGTALSGPFGQVAGFIGVTTARVPPPAPSLLLAAAAAVAALLVLAAWLLVRRSLRAQLAAGDTSAMDASEARLAATQARLDQLLTRLTEEEGRE